MHLKFTKMHGLGNDFLVLELVTQHFEISPELIQKWGDRRTGIGFDQLLVVHPPSNPKTDFRYRIFNVDGTEVQQCGNGARCIAKYVSHVGLTIKKSLQMEALGGIVHTSILDDIADSPYTSIVRVGMGIPRTKPSAIPFLADEPAINYVINTGSQDIEFVPLSIGNPHAVIIVDNVNDAPITEWGQALQTNNRFPEGVNVGFMQIVDRQFVRLRVFERGVGETLACGTGACAGVVAGHLLGKLDDRVKVSLPGGKVRVMWPGESSMVEKTGPATWVYDGELRT